MVNLNKETTSDGRRRRVVLGLILSGLGLVLAVMWGVWAILHNQTGVLIVTSRPNGAEVVLNYRPTDVLTNAFLSDLPADSFIVSVRMDGFRPIPPTQGVAILPNETTRVTFLLSPIARGDPRELPRSNGNPLNWSWRTVRINSAPQDAALLIDDRELGVKTPVTVVFEEGLHHLQARWPDGSRSFKNIVIDPAHGQPDIMLRPVTYVTPQPIPQDTTQ